MDCQRVCTFYVCWRRIHPTSNSVKESDLASLKFIEKILCPWKMKAHPVLPAPNDAVRPKCKKIDTLKTILKVIDTRRRSCRRYIHSQAYIKE